LDVDAFESLTMPPRLLFQREDHGISQAVETQKYDAGQSHAIGGSSSISSKLYDEGQNPNGDVDYRINK
jgi:hypothetical protein